VVQTAVEHAFEFAPSRVRRAAAARDGLDDASAGAGDGRACKAGFRLGACRHAAGAVPLPPPLPWVLVLVGDGRRAAGSG